MKLFQKPCADTNDVDAYDQGVKRGSKKQNAKNRKGNGLIPSDQYEYVRKEFGYDYVPPSQYVPSQSFDDDEDDYDDDEDDYDYRDDVQYNNPYYDGRSKKNDPLPYQNHVGPVPVRVVDPRSELSAEDVDEEFDNFHQPPQPRRSRQKAQQKQQHRQQHPNRRSKTNDARDARNVKNDLREIPPPASQRQRPEFDYQDRQQNSKVVSHERQRDQRNKHQSNVPIRSDNHHHDGNDGIRQDRRPVSNRGIQTRSQNYPNDTGRGQIARETREGGRPEQHIRSSRRPVQQQQQQQSMAARQRSHSPSFHRNVHDDHGYLREKKSFLDDEPDSEGSYDNDDDNDRVNESRRVHRAYSYASNDSAEVFVKERSSGSRYKSTAATTNNKRNIKQRGVDDASLRREQARGRQSPRIDGVELQDNVGIDVYENAISQQRNQKLRNSNHRSDRTRREDKHVTDSSDFKQSRGKHNTKLVSDHERQSRGHRHTYDETQHRERGGPESDQYDRRATRSSRQVPQPRLHQRERLHQSHRRRAEEADRHTIDRVSSEEFQVEVEHGDFEPYYDDMPPSNYRGGGSYYTTPSGKASDVQFIEKASKPNEKRKSKGLFSKIRDSVRGSTGKKSSGTSVSKEKPVTNRRGEMRSKPRKVFEQIPPSLRSDVSFNHPSHRHSQHVGMPGDSYDDNYNYYDDANLGYNSPRHNHHHGHHRHQHYGRSSKRGYDGYREQSSTIYDNSAENQYMEDDYEKERIRRQLHRSPRGRDNDEYWDESSTGPSIPSPREPHSPYSPAANHSSRRTAPSQPPDEPFEFFDSEPVPALRSNPDRRRQVPVSRTMVRRHPNQAIAAEVAPATVPSPRYDSNNNNNYTSQALVPGPDAQSLQPFSQSLVKSPSLVDLAFPSDDNKNKGLGLFRCT